MKHTLFISAIGINLIRGKKVNCGCSGEKHHRQIHLKLVIFDFFLLALSLVIAVFGGGSLALDNLPYIFRESLFLNWILPFAITVSCILVTFNLGKQLIGLLDLDSL
jgi:hypothetical protein